MPCIGILGTLDTKGQEFAFIKKLIEDAGIDTLVVDVGVLGGPGFEPDIINHQVAEAGGVSLDILRKAGDRGQAIAVMTKGVEELVKMLFDEGKIDGLISLGGSAGTTIGTAGMRALPVGIPKVMVSTMASGDTSPYVGGRDVTMMYSVVDISGINRLSGSILSNAASAVCGMVSKPDVKMEKEKPLVGATMFGVTTPCVTRVQEILESTGYEVLVFHATGSGGRAMEDLVQDGFMVGVLDITTTELADELVGGVLSAGPHRLEPIGKASIPHVVVPGALDMVNFGPIDTVPERFQSRNLYVHNPTVTLMRTTVEENAELGRIMANKLNQSKGPTVVAVPLKGVSAIDTLGGPFHDPQADRAWLENLKAGLDSRVEVVEMDFHINDPEFSQRVVDLFLERMEKAINLV